MMASPNRKQIALGVFVGILAASASAYARNEPNEDRPITRKEFAEFLEKYSQFQADYAQIKEENQQLKGELADVRARLSTLPAADTQADFEQAMARERTAILNEVRQQIVRRTEPLLPGLSNFTLAGTAVAGFQNREEVDSTFGAGFAPVFLWKPTERLLFEAQVGFGLTEDDTDVELEYAQITYLLNDYVTIGAGKFLLPFATFWERWHPAWVNKLPTMPQIYMQGLVGATGLGVQARGGAPIGPTKINYAAYVINGPDFRTGLVSAGRLGFGNHRDNNNNKAVGGRFGFLPIPELELGYSILAGRVGDSGASYSGTDTIIHGIDLSYAREFDAIKGRLDLRAEAVWVDTDDVIFTGPFKPFTFNNNRNGWFVQAAYRPTQTDIRLGERIELRNLEFVVRYDQVFQHGPGRLGIDRDQLTFGVDYWIAPNIVLKAAFVFDDAHGEDDQNGAFIQMAVGL